jgi:PIN domain nuclease of toxin-antitoxin system
MKLLFDTHTFIWWDSDSAKLTPKIISLCQNLENTVLLSVVSVWEIQIKLQLGKIRLTLPLKDLIDSQKQMNGIDVLPIALTHVLELANLPAYHKDPFDRLLIAQARVEDAILISADPAFANYPVKLLW